MPFVSTRQATKLTGLSTAKLREWTSRRALIPADVPPKAQGSPAQYSWQTILLLRLAVTLRERFHLELQAHCEIFRSLRCNLQEKSFLALWGKLLALHGEECWSLLDAEDIPELAEDVLLIRLDPHLEVLATRFPMPHPFSAPGQLDLYPIQSVSGRRAQTTPARHTSDATARQTALRRKSA